MARIGAILLAAGESRRWGVDNKLTARVGDMPMVARTAAAILASSVRPVIVVLGHEADAVRAALGGLPVEFRVAKDYATGMAASLKTGIAALPTDCDGALICLGDMPWVSPNTLDRLADAFDPAGEAMALLPTCDGESGNPVVLGRKLFPEIENLTGDRGARALFATIPGFVAKIAVDDPGILRDADLPTALEIPVMRQ